MKEQESLDNALLESILFGYGLLEISFDEFLKDTTIEYVPMVTTIKD